MAHENHDRNYAQQYVELLEKPDFWRLFIDGARQSHGQQIADQFAQQDLGYSEAALGHLKWVLREPHSLDFLKRAARVLFVEYKNASITLDLFKEIHSIAYPHQDHLHLTKDYLFSDESRYFNIPRTIATYARKLSQTISTTYKVTPPWNIHNMPGNLPELEATWDMQTIERMFPKLQANYEQKLSLSETTDQKISAIIEFLQTIEYIHPAHDGNNRVVYLLLNLALMQNDLIPTMLYEPLGFETKTVDEMVKLVKDGQTSFIKFQNGGLPFDAAIPNEQINKNLAIATSQHEIKPLLEGNVDYAHAKEYIKYLTNYIAQTKTATDIETLWNDALLHFYAFTYAQICMNQQTPTQDDIDLIIKNMHPQLSYEIMQGKLEYICEFSNLLNYTSIVAYHHDKHNNDSLTIASINEFLEALTHLCDERLDHYSLSLRFPEYAHLTDEQYKEIVGNNATTEE